MRRGTRNRRKRRWGEQQRDGGDGVRETEAGRGGGVMREWRSMTWRWQSRIREPGLVLSP